MKKRSRLSTDDIVWFVVVSLVAVACAALTYVSLVKVHAAFVEVLK